MCVKGWLAINDGFGKSKEKNCNANSIVKNIKGNIFRNAVWVQGS